jgi:hypothetical protein
VTDGLPGGLRLLFSYDLPLEELPLLSEYLTAGMKAVRSNGAVVPMWAVERLADIAEAVAVLKAKRADVVRDVVRDVVSPLHPGKLEGVVPFGNDEIGLAQVAALVGVTRQAIAARIHRQSLPARKDDRGRWLVPRSALEAN